MGIREIQSPLKEFKSSEYFLFHIAYDEQSSYLYISGYSPKIYTLQNVEGVRKTEPTYEILNVKNEPQGLAIGYNKKNLFILIVKTVLLRLDEMSYMKTEKK